MASLMASFLVDPTTAKARQEAHAENGTCKSSGACIADLDSTIQAEYQYTQTQHPEKHMDALIRFLIEQQRKCKGDQQ